MIVEQGQSFWDMVIQGTGDIDNAFEMALLNGVSVTDVFPIGYNLKATNATKKSIVSLWNANHKPATLACLPASGDLSPEYGGIGYMIIEDTFIIS